MVNEDFGFIYDLLFPNSQIFWFGDLNYRINMSDGEIRKLVDLKKWNELMKFDQVRNMKLGVSNMIYSKFYLGLSLELPKWFQVLIPNLDSNVNLHIIVFHDP